MNLPTLRRELCAYLGIGFTLTEAARRLHLLPREADLILWHGLGR